MCTLCAEQGSAGGGLCGPGRQAQDWRRQGQQARLRPRTGNRGQDR